MIGSKKGRFVIPFSSFYKKISYIVSFNIKKMSSTYIVCCTRQSVLAKLSYLQASQQTSSIVVEVLRSHRKQQMACNIKVHEYPPFGLKISCILLQIIDQTLPIFLGWCVFRNLLYAFNFSYDISLLCFPQSFGDDVVGYF